MNDDDFDDFDPTIPSGHARCRGCGRDFPFDDIDAMLAHWCAGGLIRG